MSPSFMKKTMVYLGLLDDEYDEYDDLEDRAPRGFSAATRVEPRVPEYEQPEEYSGGMSRVRTIPRESAVPSPAPAGSEQRRPAPAGRAGHGRRPLHQPGLPPRPPRPGCTWWRLRGSATPRRSRTA